MGCFWPFLTPVWPPEPKKQISSRGKNGEFFLGVHYTQIFISKQKLISYSKCLGTQQYLLDYMCTNVQFWKFTSWVNVAQLGSTFTLIIYNHKNISSPCIHLARILKNLDMFAKLLIIVFCIFVIIDRTSLLSLMTLRIFSAKSLP